MNSDQSLYIMSKRLRTYLAVSAGIFGVLAAGCSSDSVASASDTAQKELVEVAVTPAESVTVPNALALDGTLRARRQARVSPIVSGHVERVLVERGDLVKEGQVMIELRASDLRLEAQAAASRAAAQLEQLGVDPKSAKGADPEKVASVAAAKADWEAARDQLERNERLHENGAVSDQQLTQSRAMEAAARARYEAARQAVSASLSSYAALSADAARRSSDAQNTKIRAPFTGSVMKRSAEVGEFVGPQTPVVELIDASELRLELQVPERQSTKIREGQIVEVEVDGSEVSTKGEVKYVAAALDEARRTLTVEVVVPNPEGQLRAGHFARARIVLDGTRALLRVPATAVRERAGVERLFAVDDQGVATARIVTSVRREGDFVLVEGELASGEAVVIDPPPTLADGAKVRIQGREG